MKVFVVVDHFNDGGAEGDFLWDIFDTKEKAQEYIKEEWHRYDYEIKEWEVK